MTIITTEQQVSLTLSALTAAGNPATGELNGSPLWSSSNVGIVSLVVASNGRACYAWRRFRVGDMGKVDRNERRR